MYLRSRISFILLALSFGFASPAMAAPFYGRESLAKLREYGVAVRVLCTGALSQHNDVFRGHIENRLRNRGVEVVPAGSVVLKLVVNSIQSEDGFFVAHMAMELDQTAFLASNNKMVEAPTWDAWKMGEYREEDLLQEIDDLARQFLNDYIATN
jgi:hypothetical protein